MDGTQLRSGLNMVYSDTSFRGAESGEKTDIESDFAVLMNGYLTHKINDVVSIGGGIFTPFGLATSWDNQYQGCNQRDPKASEFSSILHFSILCLKQKKHISQIHLYACTGSVSFRLRKD